MRSTTGPRLRRARQRPTSEDSSPAASPSVDSPSSATTALPQEGADAAEISTGAKRRTQRAHRPSELGPRLEQRGRWWTADLRPWGGQRYTSLRDPNAHGWPELGDRTESADVADRWKWSYVELLTGERRRRHLGLRARGQPLGRAIERYLEARETERLAPSTIRGDQTALEAHLLAALGRDCPVDTIELDRVQLVFDALARQGYTAGTLTRYKISVGSFFKWTGRRDDENPGYRLVVPEIIGGDNPRTLDAAELDDLRGGADEMDAGRGRWAGPSTRPPFPMRRAIELGLGMGGRQAELFALDWPAFRERERTVRVAVQIDRVQGGLKHLKGKLGRTALVLPSWWAHHEPHGRGLVLGAQRFDGTWLHQTQNWLNRLYEHVGLKVYGQCWHVLRHTYARTFLEAGGRLEQLQKFLGHRSIVTTETRYGHFSEQAAATLARQALYGADPEPPRAGRLARRSGTSG